MAAAAQQQLPPLPSRCCACCRRRLLACLRVQRREIQLKDCGWTWVFKHKRHYLNGCGVATRFVQLVFAKFSAPCKTRQCCRILRRCVCCLRCLQYFCTLCRLLLFSLPALAKITTAPSCCTFPRSRSRTPPSTLRAQPRPFRSMTLGWNRPPRGARAQTTLIPRSLSTCSACMQTPSPTVFL